MDFRSRHMYTSLEFQRNLNSGSLSIVPREFKIPEKLKVFVLCLFSDWFVPFEASVCSIPEFLSTLQAFNIEAWPFLPTPLVLCGFPRLIWHSPYGLSIPFRSCYYFLGANGPYLSYILSSFMNCLCPTTLQHTYLVGNEVRPL